ncbi:hypothetical protein LRX75_11835 [Rhizobium sp. DKSPLA3]|uniref:Uncharacterized protein n=1 Tax=Rhizobium quercicola TaxID=2901226 RepID=A0A9X1NUU0_9HYPH|nr:hypothetical protein [Rhizobium quercicola]MCD7109728.1 hypothetical protein [Rhizobium quercicola]
MTIIALKDGRYVNSDHVLSYRTFSHETRFHMSDGSDVSGDPHDELYPCFHTILPALPGFRAIYALKSADGRRYVERTVIAWRHTDSGNWPLFQGYTEDDMMEYVAIVEPSGKVFDDEGYQFETLEAWRTFFEEHNPVPESAVAV